MSKLSNAKRSSVKSVNLHHPSTINQLHSESVALPMLFFPCCRSRTICLILIHFIVLYQLLQAVAFRPRQREVRLVALQQTSTGSSLGSTSVVVVGSGIGGLAVASRVASTLPTSAKVTVLEKNEFAGGRCGSVHVQVPQIAGKFRHERGPSLLLLPQVYQKVFSDCGSTPEENGLEMLQCIPAYQVVFEDGDRVDVGFPRKVGDEMSPAEVDSRAKMDAMEEKGSLKWDAYQQACEAFLDCGLPNFIEEKLDLKTFPAFLRESLADLGKAWPLKPHSEVVDRFFASNKMRALASFQDLYVGLEPYTNEQSPVGGIFTSTAPAVFGLLSAIELHPTNEKSGVFAPKGGFEAVTKSLLNLATKKGVDVITNAFVTGIVDNKVDFETPSGRKSVTADVVVVNADLPYATKVLVDSPRDEASARYDWDDKYLFSSGVVAFHWSIQRELVDLRTHNVFMVAGDREGMVKSWNAVRGTMNASDTWPSEFNFYVHRASAVDSSAAPPGCDSIMVLVPCPALDRNSSLAELPRQQALQQYAMSSARIDSIRAAVLERLSAVESLAALQSDIVHETVDTPGSYADLYNLGAGTPFGLSHGLKQLSKLRPAMTSPSHPRIVFCGASTRPGNGVPLVLIGAEQATGHVLRKIEYLARSNHDEQQKT